jgi:hypothetical protein
MVVISEAVAIAEFRGERRFGIIAPFFILTKVGVLVSAALSRAARSFADTVPATMAAEFEEPFGCGTPRVA